MGFPPPVPKASVVPDLEPVQEPIKPAMQISPKKSPEKQRKVSSKPGLIRKRTQGKRKSSAIPASQNIITSNPESVRETKVIFQQPNTSNTTVTVISSKSGKQFVMHRDQPNYSSPKKSPYLSLSCSERHSAKPKVPRRPVASFPRSPVRDSAVLRKQSCLSSLSNSKQTSEKSVKINKLSKRTLSDATSPQKKRKRLKRFCDAKSNEMNTKTRRKRSNSDIDAESHCQKQDRTKPVKRRRESSNSGVDLKSNSVKRAGEQNYSKKRKTKSYSKKPPDSTDNTVMEVDSAEIYERSHFFASFLPGCFQVLGRE